MSLVASPKPSSERSGARAARASKIRDDLWAEACRREEALRDLMRLHPGRFPEIVTPDACVALGVSRAALFQLIERFKRSITRGCDVAVVDEETREPVCRPWITLAMDIFMRAVTGLHLTMDAPSRFSISLCRLHAVYDKAAWLAEREIEEEWPISRLPDTIHVDHGDFRSRA